jgi:hypothetical protein
MATDEELESLREKSVRASTVYDELEAEERSRTSAMSSVRSFTPRQRVILAFLLLLDVIALVIVVVAWSGA